ncbi:hypothetical protein GRX03_00930 [Halovenus sp. WSH3]|uniref:Uncharacterized protein n=1 Tax=Halovenus carboxidivorans TaxID=2692199 RepID=A0A6B0SX72_9EURY|nr:hypothetical protein [Halovenus carboxidivorans]
MPVYSGKAAVEAGYAQAQQEGVPFFGIEEYEEGYAVTYDLLPADEQLAPTARKEVQTRLTAEVEDIVGDSELATVEVSKSVNDSLGNVSLLETEASARRIARAIAPIVLDAANWDDR